MSAVTRPQLHAKFDQSALKVLGALSRPKIFISVESALYFGCCGGYEEKSLKIETDRENNNQSDLFLLEGKVPIYIDKEALALITSRGNYFTIYADLSGVLYSDQ